MRMDGMTGGSPGVKEAGWPGWEVCGAGAEVEAS